MSNKVPQSVKNLFSSSTPYGRIIRTSLQVFIGLSGALIAVLGVPEVYEWFATLPLIAQIGGLTAVVTAVAAIQNYSKQVWEYIKEW